MESKQTSAGRLMSAEEAQQVDLTTFYVKITVEFGDEFLKGKKVTKAAFVDLMRAEAKAHPRSTVSPLVAHLADHLESKIQAFGDADGSPPPSITNYYKGCPSCRVFSEPTDANPEGHNPGQVCCEDGTCWCEIC